MIFVMLSGGIEEDQWHDMVNETEKGMWNGQVSQ